MMVVFTILETGEISRVTYMKSMGLKFSARTDFSATLIDIFKHSKIYFIKHFK